MKIKSLLSACLAILASTSYGQTVTKLTATKANDFGLIYSLPTTVLDITIEAEHTKAEAAVLLGPVAESSFKNAMMEGDM